MRAATFRNVRCAQRGQIGLVQIALQLVGAIAVRRRYRVLCETSDTVASLVPLSRVELRVRKQRKQAWRILRRDLFYGRKGGQRVRRLMRGKLRGGKFHTHVGSLGLLREKLAECFD